MPAPGAPGPVGLAPSDPTGIGATQVAPNQDGRLEAFIVGSDGHLWHRYQTSRNAGWSSWLAFPLPEHQPTVTLKAPTVVGRNADGRLEVFALGGDGRIYHSFQVAPNLWWSPFDDLTPWDPMTALAPPVVASNQDGRLQIFAKRADGHLWSASQVKPNGIWSSWTSMSGGTAATMPAVGRDTDGRLEMFVGNSDSFLWQAAQTTPGGAWSVWVNTYMPGTETPAVAPNADGRLAVLSVGAQGVYQDWELTPSGAWAGYALVSFTSPGSSSAAFGRNADGRLEAFVTGSDHAVWHAWETSPNGGWVPGGNPYSHPSWSAFVTMGNSVVGAPTVATDADGRFEVFAHSGTLVWDAAQGVGGANCWSSWTSLGSP